MGNCIRREIGVENDTDRKINHEEMLRNIVGIVFIYFLDTKSLIIFIFRSKWKKCGKIGLTKQKMKSKFGTEETD